jgi:Protein of unknown function (DUF1553)/Protein of unknown function (DUF1549)/Planctomycete cytochrome C/Concanavalin A-like lectin/glucanases superfamily
MIIEKKMMKQMKNIEFVFLGIFVFLTSCGTKIPPEVAAFNNKLPATIDYNLHIKPILSDRCFKCHGPDANKREAGLRLDLEDVATKKLESGNTAIVPGDVDKSELVKRILSKEHKYLMPTPESNLVLNDEERATLIKWIDQGAKYKPHWSFVKPELVDVPKVKNTAFVVNEIDNFILQKIEAKNLKTSSIADKATLLKRASIDITGLPPKVAEFDTYMADNSPKAYEKLVDKMLASPHYGEKMTADWLDLARYADTHGYQDDGYRNVYPYRDWVIKSFNENLGYDKFITYQLAGDLLEKPTREQLIATCFNRNHSQTQEGGVVDEEYRNEYVIDRVNTFGKAFLSISLECARCHDHKYDPVTQKEFYQMYAYFNSNNESGIIPYNGEASPTITLTTKEVDNKLAFIRKKIAIANDRLSPSNFNKDFEKWLVEAQKSPEMFAKPKPYYAENKVNPSLKMETLYKKKSEGAVLQTPPPSKNFVSKTEAGLIGHFEFETLVVNDAGKPQKLLNTDSTDLKGNLVGDLDRMPQTIKGIKGNAMKLIGDNGFEFNRLLDFDRQQPFTISIWVNRTNSKESGPIFQKSNGEFEGFRGYRVMLNPDGTLMVNMSYVWPSNAIDFHTIDKMKINTWQHLSLTYDGSSKASGLKLFVDGKEVNRKVRTDNLNKSILYGEKKSHWYDWSFNLGREMTSTMSNIAFDEMRAYNRQLSELEVVELYKMKPNIGDILKKKALTELEKKQLFEYYCLNFNRKHYVYRTVIEQFRDEENQLLTDQEEVMVMKELPEPRKTFILARGQYDSPTKDQVEPAIPKFSAGFPEINQNFAKNRLGLAQWLTHKNNPLTARVVVNRLWYQFFGKGLAPNIDDFGNQGAMPTHLELLDYLSIKFVESGWDVKKLIKMIVMSNTYKQTSSIDQNEKEKDPANEFYTRGTSYRLSHEQIRDKVLTASGLLNEKIGGKSVFPYQPDGIWEALTTRNLVHYTQSHHDSLYRRGLYTFWKRSSPPPSAVTFDASERYNCIIKKQKTSTPLQSLVLMNDPQYMEAARVMGERMMHEAGADVEKRITLAFKALASRNPSKSELEILRKMYNDELNFYKNKKAEAEKIINVGEYQHDKTLETSELAACTMVATTLINYDETVMKR